VRLDNERLSIGALKGAATRPSEDAAGVDDDGVGPRGCGSGDALGDLDKVEAAAAVADPRDRSR